MAGQPVSALEGGHFCDILNEYKSRISSEASAP